jgi:hypothetical protein
MTPGAWAGSRDFRRGTGVEPATGTDPKQGIR